MYTEKPPEKSSASLTEILWIKNLQRKDQDYGQRPSSRERKHILHPTWTEAPHHGTFWSDA